jgi:predicted ester cyclase
MPNDTNCIEANEDMVRRRFVELDKGNFGILDELFAPCYKLNLPGFGKPMRLAATKRFYQLLYGAFAGLRHNIIEQVSADKQVVTRWTARGTHKGVWMGVKPTGRRVSFSGINIYTIDGGKFVSSHVNWDLLGILQQIGGVKARPGISASARAART